MSTYYAMDGPLLDSYFRLHRRDAGCGYRVYRGSLLANPPQGYHAPVCLLSVCPPFLVELCHRKHSKLVLAVSFNLAVLNDKNFLTPPASLKLAVGYHAVLKERMTKHLKKLLARKHPMSEAFKQLALTYFPEPLPESDGEWVAPPSQLSVPGLPPLVPGWDCVCDEEADPEEAARLAAVADVQRPRGVGTQWGGKLRQQ